MGMAYWFARRYNLPVEESVLSWARVRRTFTRGVVGVPLPIIILGGIFGGVVTATEGAALAVVAALFVGLVDLSRARLDASEERDHRRRRADRHRDAAGRDLARCSAPT